MFPWQPIVDRDFFRKLEIPRCYFCVLADIIVPYWFELLFFQFRRVSKVLGNPEIKDGGSNMAVVW